MFENSAGPESTLDKTDAEFVDIIHSCAGTLGYSEAIGHADFFPNNGKAHQPGCGGIIKEIKGKKKNKLEIRNSKLNSYQIFAVSNFRSMQSWSLTSIFC